MDAPVAQGGAQARGRIRAPAEAYFTATASPDQSRICDLFHSLQQCQILKPLSEARDYTCILMDTSRICFFLFWLFGFLPLLGLLLQHMEIPRLGVQLEL